MSASHERVKDHDKKVKAKGLVRVLSWINNDEDSRRKLRIYAKRLRKQKNNPLPRDNF